MLQIPSPLFLSSNIFFLIYPPISSLLNYSVSLKNLQWNFSYLHCFCFWSFFCFLAVDTGSSYFGIFLSLSENLNCLFGDWSKYSLFSFYTFCNVQKSWSTFHSCNVQSDSATLWFLHSLLTFRVFLSTTFRSFFACFSIPALYLTND